MFLTACDSSESRTSNEEFDAAPTSQKTSATAMKDAGPRQDSGNKVKTDDGKKVSGQAADESCGAKSCSAPAKCEDNARCVCPKGYEDVAGDGSQCKDVDECKERSAKCGPGAGCKNTPGSYECMCSAPAYEKDGDACKCAEGYLRDDDGYCVGVDGKQCADGVDCENGHCEGGICCAQSCGEPGECKVTEGAKCSDDGKTCLYDVAKDGASCDDSKACTKDGTCKGGKCQESTEFTKCDDGNPCTDDSCEEPTGCRNQNNESTCDDGSACTRGDKCAGGQCKGETERDCTGSADACNVGGCDPKTGECTKEPRKTSVTCDDMNSCTTGDSCKDGACAGGGNACGTNATQCMPGLAGAVNVCSCKDGFITFQGRCVPMNDECQKMNPCSADADCSDPSNSDGDLRCACKPGFLGDGKECKQADPCATNPCGMGGTCTSDNQGGYTCVCAEGSRLLNGKCGCDLSGTFGVKSTESVSWNDINQFLEDGSIQVATYYVQKHTYDADANLKVEITECGSTQYDLCSVPFRPFLGAEAYGQYVPHAVYGTPSMPRTLITVSLPDSQPGAAFKTDLFALLSGIQLDNAVGEWPSDRKQVAGTSDSSGTPVNGAHWLDPDNDGSLGLTTSAVGPGGEKVDGIAPDPASDYGAFSRECPRAGGDPSPYAYPPALPNGSLSVQRIKRLFGAQRALLAYDGKVDSCDVISGSVTGPDNGEPHLDARVIGCVRVDGNGEAVCGSGAVDFLDMQPQKQKASDAKFKMKRVSADATCKDIWGASFD